MMSVMLSAGGSLRWFRDALAPGMGYDELVAAGRRAGRQRRPLFLPYLSGERSPHPDPLARGAFVGLTLGHDRRHLTRAVLEGVAYGLRDGLDLMQAAGMPAPAQIRVSGGGTASPLWRQILADVLDTELATVSTTEGAAYGAALLAAVAPGWFATVDEATAPLVTATPVGDAGPDAARYAEAHARIAALYPALAPLPRRAAARRAANLPLQLGQLLRWTSSGFLPRMIMASTSSGVTSACRPFHDPAVVHDADPVGQVEDVVDVVADQEDADALVLQLADEVADLGGLRRAEGRGRLVHDHDPGVEVDGPRDRDGLALTSGQVPDRRREVGEVRVQAAHHLAGGVLHRPIVHGPPPRHHLAPEEHVGGRVDVVGQRQRLVDAFDVQGLGVARVGDRDRLAVDQDLPESARCAPDRVRMRVDLPAPLPPTRPMTSPS